MDNDKKHVIPRDRYRRRRRVFTEDGQQPMEPYGYAADSDENNASEKMDTKSGESKTAKSAAETRREYIEEESGRSHDPVYGYEDLNMDEEQPEDGYQDVYTSGPAKSGNRAAQADEVLRAEAPLEERPENKNRDGDLEERQPEEPMQRERPENREETGSGDARGDTATSEPSEQPARDEDPERPKGEEPQQKPKDHIPESAIFGGTAAAAAGASAKNSDDRNPDGTSLQNPESMKRIERDKKGRVIKGDPESSDNKNNFYGTVPPVGAGSGNGNNNNRGKKGGGGGGFFRSFLIPLIAGILGALLVILLFNVFDGDEPEETATNEQEAGTEQEAEQSADGNGTETEATQAIEASRDSVVSVINLQRVDSLLPGIFGEDAETQQTEPEEAGIGSGVIYKTEGDTSYIVTNFHVVEGAEELQINMQNGESVTANVVGTDVWTDLAVLSIPSEQVEGTLDFADSDELTVGQTAIAIGSPLGEAFSGSVSQGIVSGLDRSVPVDLDGDGGYDWEANVIQTDAAINPGNSGGALIDSNGNLIGINSMKISMPQVEGIGFAIPADEVQKVVSQIEENGEVQRPFLGVTLQDLYTIPPEVLANEMNVPEDVNSGVVISSVQPGSPADNVGMQQLDLVTALDGNQVGNMMELRQYLYYEKQPGDEMTVEFYRGGEQQTVTVTLQ